MQINSTEEFDFDHVLKKFYYVITFLTVDKDKAKYSNKTAQYT